MKCWSVLWILLVLVVLSLVHSVEINVSSVNIEHSYKNGDFEKRGTILFSKNGSEFQGTMRQPELPISKLDLTTMINTQYPYRIRVRLPNDQYSVAYVPAV